MNHCGLSNVFMLWSLLEHNFNPHTGYYNGVKLWPAWHRNAEGLLFCSCGLCFFSTPNLWGHWTDHNQTWTHIHLWLLFEKFCLNCSRHLPPRAGGKNTAFCDHLWKTEHISATIGKKLVNLHRLNFVSPKFGEHWSRNDWEWLASFCLPLNFLLLMPISSEVCLWMKKGWYQCFRVYFNADTSSRVGTGLLKTCASYLEMFCFGCSWWNNVLYALSLCGIAHSSLSIVWFCSSERHGSVKNCFGALFIRLRSASCSRISIHQPIRSHRSLSPIKMAATTTKLGLHSYLPQKVPKANLCIRLKF